MNVNVTYWKNSLIDIKNGMLMGEIPLSAVYHYAYHHH